MLFKDLREFLALLEERGELKNVHNAHWKLEIGAITELMAEQQGPALLFDKIPDHAEGFRVVTNMWASLARCALVTGMPPEVSGLDYVKKWRELVHAYKPVPPKVVKDGPVMENIQRGKDVNMLQFPTPWWHELDGGRFIGTGSCTILRDPESGKVNFGTYRVQLHDDKLLGFYKAPGSPAHTIRQRYWEKGQNCPVAISFGHDPALYAASTFGALQMEEYEFAGYLRGEPIEVIIGPVTGLPIPANSELVIEGEAPPPSKEMHLEGPFGESPGYYAHGALQEPVIHVKAVYYRNNPIIQGEPPLKPPLVNSLRHCLWSAASMWDQLEMLGFPDITGVYWPDATRHSMYIISLKQRYPGHAMAVGMAAASHCYFARIIILVDDDIDPSNLDDVLWAVSSRCEPAESINILKGMKSGPLDPRMTPEDKERGNYLCSVAVIDACKPYHWKDRFPPTNKISDELRQETLEKWRSLFGKK